MNQLQQALHGWHDRQQQIADRNRPHDRLPSAGQPPASDAGRGARFGSRRTQLETEIRSASCASSPPPKSFGWPWRRPPATWPARAEDLDRGETGSDPQQAEQDAVASLARLLEALRPAKPKPQGRRAEGGDGKGRRRSTRQTLHGLAGRTQIAQADAGRFERPLPAAPRSNPTPRTGGRDERARRRARSSGRACAKMSQQSEADDDGRFADEEMPAEPPDASPKGKRRLDPVENPI